MKLQDAADSYLEHKRLLQRVSASSADTYHAHLRRFMKAVGPRKGVQAAAGLVQPFLLELGRRGASDSYARKAFQVLRDFYRWAHENGHSTMRPLHERRAPIVHKPKRTFLTREQIRELLEAIRRSGRRTAQRDHALFASLYYSMLRVTEACRSRPEDWDLETCTVRVFGKGGKTFLIPFHPALAPILRAWLKLRPSESPMMFPSLSRTGTQPGVLERIRVEFMLREIYAPILGLESVTPHTLRRSAADHLRRGGAELVAIKGLLRHEDLGTTMDYLDLGTPDELKGAWKKLDG